MKTCFHAPTFAILLAAYALMSACAPSPQEAAATQAAAEAREAANASDRGMIVMLTRDALQDQWGYDQAVRIVDAWYGDEGKLCAMMATELKPARHIRILDVGSTKGGDRFQTPGDGALDEAAWAKACGHRITELGAGADFASDKPTALRRAVDK